MCVSYSCCRYNYAKAGATKVGAGSAVKALSVARQVEAEDEKAKAKAKREERLADKPKKRRGQGGRSNGGGSNGGGSSSTGGTGGSFGHKRKEKNKAKVGNHHRKERSLRKQAQGM